MQKEKYLRPSSMDIMSAVQNIALLLISMSWIDPVTAQYSYNRYRQPVTSVSSLQPNWTDCGDEKSVVRFTEISVDQYPLRWGQTVYVTAEVEFLTNIEQGIRSLASIGPMPLTRDREIPCLADNFGSCDTDFCTMVSDPNLLVCRFLESTGNPCSCPLSPGVYRADRFAIPMPRLPPILRFFANRPYWAKWYWYHPGTNDVLACIAANLRFHR